MKFLFRLAIVLKIVFVINAICIALYHEYGFEKGNLSPLLEKLDLGIEIQLPFYVRAMALILPISYIITVFTNYLYSFRPCSKLSLVFHEAKTSTVLFLLEVMLCAILIFLASSKIRDAFETPDYGIFDSYLQRFVDQGESAKLHLLDKLSALNLLLPILACVLIISTLWRVRKINLARCGGGFTEN